MVWWRWGPKIEGYRWVDAVHARGVSHARPLRKQPWSCAIPRLPLQLWRANSAPGDGFASVFSRQPVPAKCRRGYGSRRTLGLCRVSSFVCQCTSLHPRLAVKPPETPSSWSARPFFSPAAHGLASPVVTEIRAPEPGRALHLPIHRVPVARAFTWENHGRRFLDQPQISDRRSAIQRHLARVLFSTS
ncbi:hypothetical protein BDV96DRAFT_170630 [Lophiotrema nucula]|uniref:Uncharacterized protein n=1 Tax=Lophiotrema nucula TaxID=690887 RepID=A0A6A5Z180_9PLEO|nr:hypothetical protein BDV96DRAFT_170630 [Lophiotrema nucula]